MSFKEVKIFTATGSLRRSLGTHFIHTNVHALWHITTPGCSTGEQFFTLTTDPELLAAWHPVLSSADPGPGDGPLALNSGLIYR